MDYKTTIEKLRKDRESLASKINTINDVITALIELNGKSEGEEKPSVSEPITVTHKKKAKATMVVRKHERAGMILKRIGMHYVDVALDAVRRAGRPVTTEEVYQHLRKLAGKQLNRRIYMTRIGVCLRREALNGNIAQSKVPDSPHRESLWNAINAKDLQNTEIMSAEVK